MRRFIDLLLALCSVFMGITALTHVFGSTIAIRGGTALAIYIAFMLLIRRVTLRAPAAAAVMLYAASVALCISILVIAPVLLSVNIAVTLPLVFIMALGAVPERMHNIMMLVNVIAIMVVVGVVYSATELAGIYSAVELWGTALVTVITMVIGTLLLLNLQRARLQAQSAVVSSRETLERQIVLRTAELQDQRDLAQSMLRTADQPMAVINRDGTYRFVNNAFCALLGGTPEHYIGRSATTVVPAHERRKFDDHLDARARGEETDAERDLMRIDGSLVRVHARSVPIVENGQVTGALVVAEDLTKRLATEAALRTARDEAVAASQLRSRFLATVSHEIRTPLNPILGMTELVLDTPLNPEQRMLLQTVRDSGESLLALINNVLDFSRIENGQIKLVDEPYSPRLVAEKALALFAPRLEQRGIQLVAEYGAGTDAPVMGDANRVRQVLVNLLGNAEKFTEHGRIKLRMVRDTQVRFEVSDTGIGIAPEHQAQLFEPFRQADNSTTRRHDGSGLGLAICKSLVTAMGGRIGLHSSAGAGSTFWFEIPARAPAEGQMLRTTGTGA